MTPARIAVATALTHTKSSEPSSTPPPSQSPSIRQTSLGRKPAISSTSSAFQSPRKWPRKGARKSLMAVPANSEHHSDARVQGGGERKQCQPQQWREDIGKLPAVAGGGKQKCQRRQQQDRRG